MAKRKKTAQIKILTPGTAHPYRGSIERLHAVYMTGALVEWTYNGERMPPLSNMNARECPSCKRLTVHLLPPALLAVQPDATTAVCHPAIGGCNQGFELV